VKLSVSVHPSKPFPEFLGGSCAALEKQHDPAGCLIPFGFAREVAQQAVVVEGLRQNAS
jgi:hypothetical protein